MREEITGAWRLLGSEELYDLYFSPDYVTLDKMKLYGRGGTCSTLVNPEETTPGMRRRIWKENLKLS